MKYKPSVEGLKQYLIPIVCGILLSRTLQPLLFPIEIGIFAINLGNIGFFFLILCGTLLIAGINTRWIWVGTAVAFDQMIYLICKSNPSFGFFSIQSILGSVIFLVISILFIMFFDVQSRTRIYSSLKSRFFYIFLIAIVIGIFRISQLLLYKMGVSNEHRSIILLGFEIHHINFGLIMVWILAHIIYFFPLSEKLKRISAILLAVGIAFISDQISYYALKEITDISYNQFPSFMGAFSVLIIIMILQFLIPFRTNKKNSNILVV
ncbi:MAG: hypothetical protein ACMUIU_13270 [bacterium]